NVTAAVLQALGVDPDTARELIALRDATPGDTTAAQVKFAEAIAPELGPDFLKWEAEKSQIVTIEAEADLQQTRNRSRVSAAIEMGEDSGNIDSTAVRVLRWQD